MSSTASAPPSTPVEPVIDVLHGVPITDQYRWLEDANSARTRKWIEQQITYARHHLNAIPGRDRIRRRVEELLAVQVISFPYRVGDRYFFLKRTPHEEQPVITMRETWAGEDIPLVDPAQRREGKAIAVGIHQISRDGSLLAYSVRQSGDDHQAIEILDVNQKRALPDQLPYGLCGGLVFSPDNSGFYHSHTPRDDKYPHRRVVRWHKLGTNPENDSETFFAGEDPRLRFTLLASPDGQYLGLSRTFCCDSLVTDFFVQNLMANEPPRLIAEQVVGRFLPYFSASFVIALTDWNSPKGRIIKFDLNQRSSANWVEVVPESHVMLRDVAVSDRRIFAGYIDDTRTHIEMFDSSGVSLGSIPCPQDGTARLLRGDPESDELFYSFTSFSQPPSIHCYHAQSGLQKVWAKHEVPFDSSSVEVERARFASKDGTLIPISLIREKGHRGSQRLPTFLTGYGGFGVSITPQFTAYAAFLLEQGFLMAVANLRGGSEFGGEWHEAAKRHCRQNAFDDFISAAEWLIAEGHADPERLAIGGGSNAGLLVGAALTQRPDLFRAVICLGPLLDMLRYHKFDQASRWIEEYGCADNRNDFDYLRAYSPYHSIRAGVRYPAVMLISGDADTRCNPLHARKMAARLQTSTISGLPILLDYRATWGHMAVQPLGNRIEALTDRLAFICHQLGVEVR